jgi:hypothetical protein
MSGVNPGISAAGEAAGRTALDPSAGRAAIGGMLSVGEMEVSDEETPDRSTPQGRLSSAISDITKLAAALQGLKLKATNETEAPRRVDGADAGGGEKDSADTAA